MTRSTLGVPVRFFGLAAMLLAIAACGGGSGAGDAGQTGGTTGGGGTTGTGGTTGGGGTIGTGAAGGQGGGAGGRGGAGGSGGGAGGGGGSAATGCSGCNYTTQYCSVTVGGAVGSQPSYVCRDLPAACAADPTCACLIGKVGCGNLCSQGDAGVTVTCQAP